MLLPGAQDDFPEARADRQLGWLCAAQGSGVPGIRDEELFSSAMARPQNRAAYGDRPDVADRAAAYAFGLWRATILFSMETSARPSWRWNCF